MSKLTEQVDDYVKIIIDDAQDGRPSRLGNTSYYRDDLIKLITKARVAKLLKWHLSNPTNCYMCSTLDDMNRSRQDFCTVIKSLERINE